MARGRVGPGSSWYSREILYSKWPGVVLVVAGGRVGSGRGSCW